MGSKRYSILNRIGLCFLVGAVLNLFQACTVFRPVGQPLNDDDRIAQFAEKGKYFILYSSDGVHHLSNIKLEGQNLTATVSALSEKHKQYLLEPGEKPGALSGEGKETLAQEVVLVTKLEIPPNSTFVTIPLGAVESIYVYKTKLRTGSVIAIVFGGIFLIFFGSMALLYAIG